MIYTNYVIGGELYHAQRANHKYIDRVMTKSGKWRYIYSKTADKKLSLQEDKIDEVNKSVSTENAKSVGPRTQALIDKLRSNASKKSSLKSAEEKVKSTVSKSSGKKSSSGSSKKSSGSKKSSSSSKGSSTKEAKSSEGKSSSSSSKAAEKKTEETKSGGSLTETEQKIQKGMKKQTDYYNEQKKTLEKLYNTYKNQKNKTSASRRLEVKYKIKLRDLERDHQETMAMYRKFMQFLKE